MAAYTKADLDGLRSLNGGTPMYLAHLKHQVGKLGLGKLREIWTRLIESEDTPADLKSQLRTLRLMSRELDEKKLEKLAAAYQRTEKAFRSIVESDKRLCEAIAEAQIEWSATCAPGQEAMRALGQKAHEWELSEPSVWRRPTITLSLPFIHNIPAAITDYDERAVKGERARLLEALNWRLATQESFDGVEEMEILDETLERLDAIWDKHFRGFERREEWAAKFGGAKQNFEVVKRDIATELGQKLPESGQFALVRMARLLWQDEYESCRPSFGWLLTREDSNGLLRPTWVPAEPRAAIKIEINH
ncbi:Uncharacterised protein [Burkholderia pseudomallei]|nr:Uncharacterised protein [Burkholderia pseudomallei]